MKQAMFYGIFYYLSTVPDLHKRWIPLTRRLAKAGWEPITYARCPALGPMIERFGRFDDRNLHFTLRNESEKAKLVELLIDANTLDLHATPQPGIWVMRDAYTHESLEAKQEGPLWRMNLTVPAKDTVVLRVATPFGLALDHLADVPALLLKAMHYRDSLCEANVATECPDFETLIEWVDSLQNMLTIRDVRPTDVIVKFHSVTAAFSESNVRAKTAETLWWSDRLAVCTAAAQQEISAALSSLLIE
jgi:hypothetical protein